MSKSVFFIIIISSILMFFTLFFWLEFDWISSGAISIGTSFLTFYFQKK